MLIPAVRAVCRHPHEAGALRRPQLLAGLIRLTPVATRTAPRGPHPLRAPCPATPARPTRVAVIGARHRPIRVVDTVAAPATPAVPTVAVPGIPAAVIEAATPAADSPVAPAAAVALAAGSPAVARVPVGSPAVAEAGAMAAEAADIANYSSNQPVLITPPPAARANEPPCAKAPAHGYLPRCRVEFKSREWEL